MGIVFIQRGNSQTVKILDSITKATLININLKTTKDKLISNELGIIKINELIAISYFGYKTISFPFPTSDTTILLNENIIRLGEVSIVNTQKKNRIIGNYEKKTNNVFVNAKIDKDIEFTIVNKFKLTNESIKALLFYVFKDENYAKSSELPPLEIVFFKAQLSGSPHKEPFQKVFVNNYTIGWNKILLDEFITSNDDVIFYGIKWVYNPLKYHYTNVRRRKSYNFFGIKLGATSIDKLYEFSHKTLIYTNEKGWRTNNIINAMIALEIN